MTPETPMAEIALSTESAPYSPLPPLREEDHELERLLYGFCVDKAFIAGFGAAQAQKDQRPQVIPEMYGERWLDNAISTHKQWSQCIAARVPTKYVYTWPKNAAGPLIPDTASGSDTDLEYTTAWLIGCADNRNARRAQPALDTENVMTLKRVLGINDDPQ